MLLVPLLSRAQLELSATTWAASGLCRAARFRAALLGGGSVSLWTRSRGPEGGRAEPWEGASSRGTERASRLRPSPALLLSTRPQG